MDIKNELENTPGIRYFSDFRTDNTELRVKISQSSLKITGL